MLLLLCYKYQRQIRTNDTSSAGSELSEKVRVSDLKISNVMFSISGKFCHADEQPGLGWVGLADSKPIYLLPLQDKQRTNFRQTVIGENTDFLVAVG